MRSIFGAARSSADLTDAQPRFDAIRLDELRVSASELAVQARLDAGDVAGAAAAAEALVAQHPLRESPVRTLALARRRAGQPAGAIRVIADFRQRLADETGLDPTPDLLALEQELLTSDSKTQPATHRQLRGYELKRTDRPRCVRVGLPRHPTIGRTARLPIKVVRPELANNPQFIRRFEVEAQMVARLEHPHIVPLHDYWREPGGAYLVMRSQRRFRRAAAGCARSVLGGGDDEAGR